MFHDDTNEVLTAIHDREFLSTFSRPFLDAVPAKTSFILGLVYGVLFLCTLGFLILLFIFV